MTEGPEEALATMVGHLKTLGKRFALVGGLAVSIRAEVRFTRDVDLVVAVGDDVEMQALVSDLQNVGYVAVAVVEQKRTGRLATVRLASSTGIVVDLIAATCGIEPEIVDRAVPLRVASAGEVPVARAEELLAMKVLSMTHKRLQDRIDARNLIRAHPSLDLDAVRGNLGLVVARGYHRGEALDAKLDQLLAEVEHDA